MDEIPRIADSVTVLRDGRRICTRPISELNTARNRSVDDRRTNVRFFTQAAVAHGPPALRVDNVSDEKLSGISFDLSRARSSALPVCSVRPDRLLRTIYGLSRPTTGKIDVIGRGRARHSPAATIAAGVGFAPEDRKREGLALNMSVSNNLVMSCPEKSSAPAFFQPKREEKIAANSIGRLGIKVSDRIDWWGPCPAAISKRSFSENV